MDKFSKLAGIIVENSNAETVTEETLLTDLEIDSLEFVYLMREIELEFNCKIEDSQYASLNTVADIMAVIP